MSLDGFEVKRFAHDGKERDVYRRGRGPGVVVMTEIPGITPVVAAFAARLADEGFTVAMPQLFGTPGRPLSAAATAATLAEVCVGREFSLLATHAQSPITTWLRALAKDLHGECGGPGVGAIGMCLTGNFALTLALDPWLLAPILSQPSLPFATSKAKAADVHLTEEGLVTLKRRVSEEKLCVLGMRFTHDRMVPKARFDTLRRELGAGFEAIEIDSSPGNPHGLRRLAHSVVTNDFVDTAGHPTRVAYDRVVSFLRERIGATP